MTDIRQDLARTAEDVAKVATEAAYVAIGIGVLGFHKAQVRRRELSDVARRTGTSGDLEGSLADARKEVAKRVKEFDATVEELIKAVDSTFEPLVQRLPDPAQAMVQQAREARDQVRRSILNFAA